MRYALIFAFLFSSFSLLAVEECDPNPLYEFMDYNFEITKEVQVKGYFDEARAFLAKYSDNVNFEVKEAEVIIAALTKVANDTTVVKGDRSQAFVYMAGMHGRISDKLQANGGTAHGKKALNFLKDGMKMDGTNKNAGNAYATTIYRLIQKNYVTRKFIEAGLSITLADEAKAAVKALDSLGLTSHPGYKALKDF